ncbi:MAG: BatA domain-containing protein, partial [Hyphomonas sp.]|nr:BatA domain-containing protein [Hyphomonas sp.]
MTALGPFLLGAPWALAALLALPVIWWILRATPPAPRHAELPSLQLLDGIEPQEETPARTPWWVWLIRTLAVAAAILGLSQPVYAPGAQTETADGTGSLLIVIDNGWTSAPRWPDLVKAATATLDTGNRDAPVHLLLTAPQQFNPDPAERLSRADMGKRLTSLRPQAWAPDRADALARLEASGVRPDRIFWASDGLQGEGGEAFAAGLSRIAPLTVYAAAPTGPVVISGIRSQT